MNIVETTRTWLQQFEPRERNAILFGGIFLIVSGLYAFIVEPIYVSHQALQQRVASKQALLSWMQQNSDELQRTRSSTPTSTNSGSLLANVDNAARSAGLGDAIRRIEQDGDSRVRVSFEAASFENIVRWLGSLEQNYGVKPMQARIDRANAPGRVNATMTLESPG